MEIKKKKGEYRVYWHYYKQNGGRSVHFRGQCISVKDLTCLVPVETMWFENQPKLRVFGFCKEVLIENNRAIIK